MQYGFVIDNRKCIGCHACTVACKSEHDVPVGVNRTWVKQTEKGTFPDTRRVFSVLRCNHCTNAPCVSICPTQALFIREDGIVDFDARRCIGCKSCMQACPYDALYIDPETHTAAKCNYCAHRTDIGLEPACVNVCPEQAIISGDLEDPHSKIAKLVATEQVTVRKPEKGTQPNLYYVNGDEASLNPNVTERSSQYIWSSQAAGVGHFSGTADDRTGELDVVQLAKQRSSENKQTLLQSKLSTLMDSTKPRRVYDTPEKGVLWGWEVSGYLLTKGISAGAILLPFIASFFGENAVTTGQLWFAVVTSLLFLGLTGLLLIKDLDQPKRFLYVLLRPQWNSWLVKGAYAITVFGGLVTLLGVSLFFEWEWLTKISLWTSGALSVLVAIYTAFLFAQAQGRDFWQSPALILHMFTHSLMGGTAAFAIANLFLDASAAWDTILQIFLIGSIALNLVVLFIELAIPHSTQDTKTVVKMITQGRYKMGFWIGTVLVGNLIPLGMTIVGGPILLAIAAVILLIGIYITEKIWVEAPQRIPLT